MGQPVQVYANGGELQLPASQRLAFRELGLAIGLRAVEQMWQASEQRRAPRTSPGRAQLQVLLRFAPLAERIVAFWRSPVNQQADTWSGHRDINEVMLATSLAPQGFLVLRD